MGDNLSVIGKSVPRVDAREKVTGQAKFAADFNIPNAGFAKLLRSPWPHARILTIDTSRAERVLGVRAVVTGEDPLNKRQGMLYADQYIIARGMVRHVGETVACVVADTEEIAEEAVKSIEVSYEELPAVFEVEEAMKPDCPVVIHPEAVEYSSSTSSNWRTCHENRPNVYAYWEGYEGDVDKGLRDAHLIVENRFSTPMAHHACLENHHVDAWPEPDGGITIRTKNKAIYTLKAHITHLFGITPSKVRIITPYIGGDFGSSGGPHPDTLAALLALRTRGPVRLGFTRKDNFLGTTVRPAQVTYVRDGLKEDGTIVARDIKNITNGGAFTGASNVITYVSALAAAAFGLYRFPNFRYRGYGVYTNLPPGGAFRGVGMPDLNWALEEQMDILADRLGADPVAFRKKHLLKEGEKNCMGEITRSVGAEACLDRVASALEWGKKPDNEGGGSRRGKGIALGCQSTPTQPPAFVHAKVHNDGIIELHHCAIEQGQGTDTVMAQVAAEAFGVSAAEIKIGPKDTASAPFGPRTGGSRSTFYVGNATWRACQDAKRQVLELAAPRLNASAESLEIRGGMIYRRDAPEKSLHIHELFSPAGFVPGIGEIIGRGECSVQGRPLDPVTGQSERSVAFHSPGAYGVQIAVDLETGEIKIEKVVGCFDMGRPINPKMCEQQIEGSIGMGIGVSLYEEMVADEGFILNPSFLDYKIPSTLEMPTLDNVIPLLDGAPHREGLFGAKGFGEATLTPFYAAVGNAFYHATGVRIKGLPLAKEKVLKALDEQK